MRLLYPLLSLLLLVAVATAQETMQEVSAPQTENIRSSEITLIAEQESVKAADGGYLANPSVVDCFAEMSYQYTGGRYDNETIKFRFHSPDKAIPDKKYPLIIWLHGVGESGEDNQRQLAHMQSTMEFLAGPHKLDCYILATQCPGDNRTWNHSISREGKGDAPLTILLDILDQVLAKYPVDQNRVSIVGICSGGHGTWPLLKAKPNFFSAAAVFAATPDIGLAWHEYCKGTKLWAFNNRQDAGVPIEPMRQFVSMVNQSGERAYLTERNGGHDAHTLAMRQDKVVAWLIEQDRSKMAPPPGLPVYVYNKQWKPFLWFALPILLSIPLAVLQVRRRWCLIVAKWKK
jgi:predicted peptidase